MGDAVLGSTAILGSVDTLLSMRRTESARFIQSIQRYGEDMAEQVIELDEDGCPVLAGTREEYDMGRASELVVAFLAKQDQEVPESAIKDGVQGIRRTMVERSLRALVEAGVHGDADGFVPDFLVHGHFGS